MSEGLSRRNALAGVATVGIGLPLLSACGGSSGTGGGNATENGGSTDGAVAGPLGPTTDIPVGGGTVFAEQKVVVTQPTEGEFKGFSAICTHQHCTVGSVADGTINCPCHGSMYSIEDGSVQGGPAPSPLPAVKLTVKGGEITVA